MRIVSFPVQSTLSKKIGPIPPSKMSLETAIGTASATKMKHYLKTSSKVNAIILPTSYVPANISTYKIHMVLQLQCIQKVNSKKNKT